jgi:hypothetical protein
LRLCLGRVSIGSLWRGHLGQRPLLDGGSRSGFTVWSGNSINITGDPSSWPKGAVEISGGASRAGELLVALGLRFGAIGAGNGCPARALGDHGIRGDSFLVVLVSPVDLVVSLEQIAGHTGQSRVHSGGRMESCSTYRRAKDIWQVKHLKGLTLVSGARLLAESNGGEPRQPRGEASYG